MFKIIASFTFLLTGIFAVLYAILGPIAIIKILIEIKKNKNSNNKDNKENYLSNELS